MIKNQKYFMFIYAYRHFVFDNHCLNTNKNLPIQIFTFIVTRFENEYYSILYLYELRLFVRLAN